MSNVNELLPKSLHGFQFRVMTHFLQYRGSPAQWAGRFPPLISREKHGGLPPGISENASPLPAQHTGYEVLNRFIARFGFGQHPVKVQSSIESQNPWNLTFVIPLENLCEIRNRQSKAVTQKAAYPMVPIIVYPPVCPSQGASGSRRQRHG
jgi:hypothetical protein